MFGRAFVVLLALIVGLFVTPAPAPPAHAVAPSSIFVDTIKAWMDNNGVIGMYDPQRDSKVASLMHDLRKAADQVGTAPAAGRTLVLYSGRVDGVDAWRYAAAISASEGGTAFTYISDTPAGRALTHSDFERTLMKAVDENNLLFDSLMGNKKADIFKN